MVAYCPANILSVCSRIYGVIRKDDRMASKAGGLSDSFLRIPSRDAPSADAQAFPSRRFGDAPAVATESDFSEASSQRSVRSDS